MTSEGRDPRAGAGATPGGGEIRAIADQMLRILEELRTFEEQKRGEALGSDRFLALAEAAEDQGRLVFRWSGLQLEVAREAARRRELGQLEPDVRIDDVQPRHLDRVLAAWREAQIRLELAKPGSPEADAAANAIERLRDEYQAIASSKSEDATALGRRFGSTGDR